MQNSFFPPLLIITAIISGTNYLYSSNLCVCMGAGLCGGRGGGIALIIACFSGLLTICSSLQSSVLKGVPLGTMGYWWPA